MIRGRTMLIAAGALVASAGLAAGATALVWSPAHLRVSPTALAGLSIPPGATVTSARAVGPGGRVTPLEVRADGLWPRRPLPSGERLRVDVTVDRPAAVGWLVGDTAHLTLDLRTPSAHVSRRWITVPSGKTLTVAFDQPVSAVVVTRPGARPDTRTLPRPRDEVALERPTDAGEVRVAAVARSWERPAPTTTVSWFPAGTGPSPSPRRRRGGASIPPGRFASPSRARSPTSSAGRAR